MNIPEAKATLIAKHSQLASAITRLNELEADAGNKELLAAAKTARVTEVQSALRVAGLTIAEADTFDGSIPKAVELTP